MKGGGLTSLFRPLPGRIQAIFPLKKITMSGICAMIHFQAGPAQLLGSTLNF